MANEIRLSDKFTLIGVKAEYENSKCHLGYDKLLGEGWLELVETNTDHAGSSRHFSLGGKMEDFTLLGTWEQFSNSPDAEERAREWVASTVHNHSEGKAGNWKVAKDKRWKHYGGDFYNGMYIGMYFHISALDSLHSAAQQIAGDIFIIKQIEK